MKYMAALGWGGNAPPGFSAETKVNVEDRLIAKYESHQRQAA
jgi:hypothetical protein